MRSKEVLSKEAFQDYQMRWGSFESKNKLETCFNVHSNLPVISMPMIYSSPEGQIMKARIFQGELRKADPYFTFKKYGNPFWHITHYYLVIEQMYHASTNRARQNYNDVVKDTLGGMNMRAPVYWDDHATVELILKRLEDRKGFKFHESVNFTIYKNDKLPVAQIEMLSYGNPRSYLVDLENMKNSQGLEARKAAADELRRKVEMQHVKHTKWALKPRQNMITTREELLENINLSRVSEEELFDFFSNWDVPKEKVRKVKKAARRIEELAIN